MPSPFPGMDPYLERQALWPDVHLELIRAVRAFLAPLVAPEYYVAVEERVYVTAIEPGSFVGRPGVTVVAPSPAATPSTDAIPTTVLERPVIVELPISDEVRERYLEIRDRHDDQVVTVIEILSPSNKRPGPDRTRYEAKRRQVTSSWTNLVEIDLLRGWERPQAHLYPFGLRESIPEIPVPLRQDQDEPILRLGELLAEIYAQVRYDLRIDYGVPPDPPLSPGDAAWADELLRQVRR